MVRNPVMFVVEVGSVLTTFLFIQALVGQGEASAGFIGTVAAWLWFTVLFANFSEALAEGRGKAQAEALRRTRQDRVLQASWHLLTLLAALLLMPLLLAALALVLLLALIPWAPVRAAAAAVQRALANTIGDSFVLLHNDIQRAAILARGKISKC